MVRADLADSAVETRHYDLTHYQSLRHHSRSFVSWMETDRRQIRARRARHARSSQTCRRGCASRRCCMDTGHCTNPISRLDYDQDSQSQLDLLFSTLTAIASLRSPLPLVWIYLWAGHVGVSCVTESFRGTKGVLSAAIYGRIRSQGVGVIARYMYLRLHVLLLRGPRASQQTSGAPTNCLVVPHISFSVSTCTLWTLFDSQRGQATTLLTVDRPR